MTAQELYTEALNRNSQLIAELQKKIQAVEKKNETKNIHFGHVGDLNYINSELCQILEFLR